MKELEVRWSYWALGIHILISILFYASYKHHFIMEEKLIDMLFYYNFGMPIVLIIGFYKGLRDWINWFCWLVISILQIWVWNTTEAADLYVRNISALRTLFIGLVAFQLFRLVLKAIKKQELILTYGRSVWYDDFDERDINYWDIAFSIVIYAVMLIPVIFY